MYKYIIKSIHMYKITNLLIHISILFELVADLFV